MRLRTSVSSFERISSDQDRNVRGGTCPLYLYPSGWRF